MLCIKKTFGLTSIVPGDTEISTVSWQVLSVYTLTFDASKSPIGEVATFTFFIESADNEKIVIRSRANIDTEEVQEYLEENNLKVDENEKTFEINVDDLETNLLLSDYIDKTTI